MALSQGQRINLTEAGSPEVVDARVTTYSYFATLGVGLVAGPDLQRRRGQAGGGAGRGGEPPAVDAALWRGRGAGRTDGSHRRRADAGDRGRPSLARRSRVAGRVDPGPLQSGESTHWKFRLERDRTAQARRRARPGGHTSGAAGAAGDGRIHPERQLSRVPDRRPLSSDRPRDEGRHHRLGPRAAVDPARDRGHGAARRLRQRREPLPGARRGTAA